MSLADVVAADQPQRRARILVIDIENTPHELYGWGLFNQNYGINQIKTPGRVFCFAAKWVGERDVLFYSEHEHGHAGMVQAAWDLLNQADIVVGYNSDRFDLTKLQWEFELARLGKPHPYKTVDLLRVARREFGAGPASKKLDYIVQTLGLGRKVQHEGMPLWISCMNGDDKAWARMRRYNIGDVRITERLYHRWLPWISNHPNMQLILGDDRCCPTCGGKKLKRVDDVLTALTAYAGYRCLRCDALLRTNYARRRVTTRTAR
jgi:hypothetical protein